MHPIIVITARTMRNGEKIGNGRATVPGRDHCRRPRRPRRNSGSSVPMQMTCAVNRVNRLQTRRSLVEGSIVKTRTRINARPLVPSFSTRQGKKEAYILRLRSARLFSFGILFRSENRGCLSLKDFAECGAREVPLF